MTSSERDAAAQLAALLRRRILPVVIVADAADARPLANALADGGLACAEVTLRTRASLDAIEAMASVPGFAVGAGTVLSAAQADDAVSAGARFLVSPGTSAEVVGRARDLGVPVVPGVVTPTEVMAALGLGLDVLKFFPASGFGGAGAVAALGGPFPDVRFVPTGGVTHESAAGFLALGNVVAVGGSWLAPPALQRAGHWRQVTARARAAVGLAASSR